MAATVVVALALAACTDSEGASSTTTAATATSDPGPQVTDPSEATIAPVDPSSLACPVTTDEAKRALQRATGYLTGLPGPRVDGTWAVQEVAERHPWLGITDALGDRTLNEPSDPARQLVDPEAGPGRLQVDATTPAGRLNADINAVFDKRTDRNLRRLDRFTARTDLTGYALTHQWLVLLWAEQVGWKLPERIRDRTDDLEARVREEVGSKGETQDLWAERVGLLALFGRQPIGEADRAAWLCRAVRTQDPRAYWRTDGTYRQPYAGGTFDVRADAQHVTAVMAMVIGGLLQSR